MIEPDWTFLNNGKVAHAVMRESLENIVRINDKWKPLCRAKAGFRNRFRGSTTKEHCKACEEIIRRAQQAKGE